MTNQFTWMDIYQELAPTLLNWQDRRSDLIAFLGNLHDQGYPVVSMQDKNRDDERFLLTEIDSFSLLSSARRRKKRMQATRFGVVPITRNVGGFGR